MIGPLSYVKPSSVADLHKHLGEAGARVHAGGTDLLGCLRDGIYPAGTIVSLRGLKELEGVIEVAGGGLRIGAMTTIDEIARHPAITKRYPALAQAAASVGSPQLRNQGTLGGNLCQRPRCWYFRGEFHCAKKGGDMCYALDGENAYHCIFGGGPCYIVHPSDCAVALTALGAQARLAGPDGGRLVPLEKFFQLPEENLSGENVLAQGEVVTEILLPPPAAGAIGAYRKVRARQAWDFALASAAIVLAIDGGTVRDARIVLGGVAPVPWRVPRAERVLQGHSLSASGIGEAAEAAVAGAQTMESNGYKVDLVKGMLRDALGKMMAG